MAVNLNRDYMQSKQTNASVINEIECRSELVLQMQSDELFITALDAKFWRPIGVPTPSFEALW